MKDSKINDSFINITKLIFCIHFVCYTCHYLIYKISYSTLFVSGPLSSFPIVIRLFMKKSLVTPALDKKEHYYNNEAIKRAKNSTSRDPTFFNKQILRNKKTSSHLTCEKIVLLI